ncbi:MAG: hypothetical protein KDB60_18620 [Propionibacteriaceae bacterium]|nr:hypothetical protein [Propionibacteriaceae bacterium]
MSGIAILGWLAALTATLLGVPQAVRLWRTRDTDGLSLVAWQFMLVLNLTWTSHGMLIGQLNMVLPNALAVTSTLPVLVLVSRDRGLQLWRVLLPPLAGTLLLIGVDLSLGSAVFGTISLVPAIGANAGQSVDLVRAPAVSGVSPVFLAWQLVNQSLWGTWALLVPDPGALICAVATGLVAVFNVAWWLARRFGLRALFATAS